MAVYLARYTRWEQEQLGCLYDYVHRRYRQLFNESGKWFDQNKGTGPFDLVEEDLNPWFTLYEDGPFAPKPALLLYKLQLQRLTFLSL